MKKEEYNRIRRKIEKLGLSNDFTQNFAKHVVRKSAISLYDSTKGGERCFAFVRNGKRIWFTKSHAYSSHGIISEKDVTQTMSRLITMFDFLYENHPKLLLDNFLKMDKRAASSKKRLESRSSTMQKRASVIFTKIEQKHIANQVYYHLCQGIVNKVSEFFADYYGAPLSVQDISFVIKPYHGDNHLLALKFSLLPVKVDQSGTYLWSCLRKIKDSDSLINEWANGKDPLLRRFALAFSEDHVIGLVDEDPKIRLSSQLRLSGESQ